MYDLAILGLGGVGCAVAFHAARRGLSVLGVDRAAPGHPKAASTAPWRGFRAAYFRDDRYVRLAARSLELWRELESLAGRTLFDHKGALLIARADHPALSGVEACGERHGLSIASWSREELHERTPFRAPEGYRAVLEEGAGLLRANDCNETHLGLAEQAGATVLAPAEVLGVARSAGGYRLRTSEGEEKASALVVAAGAGSAGVLSRLLPERRIPLSLERHPEQWFSPPDARFDSLPPYNVIVGRSPRSFHGHPNVAGRGMMIARHRAGQRVTEGFDRRTHPVDETEVRSFTSRFLPGLDDAPIVRSRVHVYCNLPDSHFAVGAVDDDRLILATALCGHGYKFASALGLGVVERHLGEAGTVDLSLFDPKRFA